MTATPCADLTCDRAAIRTREGQRWCMYHPTATPPAMDLLSGQLRDTKHLTPLRRTTTATAASVAVAPAAQVTSTPPKNRPSYRAPGRVTRPQKPASTRRADRPAGTIDAADAARRYLAGEGLHSLAASLHVGANTLRAHLREQGVTLRGRGEVIGNRGKTPRPIDRDQAVALYRAGETTRSISRALGVKTNRIQDLLRDEGLLRPPGGRHPQSTGALNSVRLRFTQDESTAVRMRAHELGLPINHYLRELVLADLQQRQEGAA